jgi:hypothetical protein
MLVPDDKALATERSQRSLGRSILRVAHQVIATIIPPDPINLSGNVECCRPFARNFVLIDHPQASTLYPTKPPRHRVLRNCSSREE